MVPAMHAVAPHSLVDSISEISLYHESDSKGFIAVCHIDPESSKFTQKSVKIDDLFNYIATIPEGTDLWVSQAEFGRPNRKMVNLTRIGVNFVDLDIYKSGAKNCSRSEILLQIHAICADSGIPSPSWVNFSGQGYQAKWLLDAYLPRSALVRWKLVQERLVEMFEPLGADHGAKDASRILRVVGSFNSKSSKMCEVAWMKGQTLDTAASCNFETLAKALLEHERPKGKKPKKEDLHFELVSNKPRNAKVLRGYHTAQLAWARLEDLRKLATLRGGIQKGMRNTYLLIVACQLALCGLVHPGNFRSEVKSLQREISNDPEWLSNTDLLGSLMSRVKAHYAKQKIELDGGRQVTPIYTYKTSSIISLLSITDDEQQQMKTLISKELATQRNTEREREKRRAQGVVERAKYLSASEDRKQQIRSLKESGLSVTEIAAALGISRPTVYTALKAKGQKTKKCKGSVATSIGEALP